MASAGIFIDDRMTTKVTMLELGTEGMAKAATVVSTLQRKTKLSKLHFYSAEDLLLFNTLH